MKLIALGTTAFLATAAVSASAAPVYTQTFPNGNVKVPGFTKTGGYGSNHTDPNSFNGTPVLVLEADNFLESSGQPGNTRYVADTSVTADASTTYTVTFDSSKSNTGVTAFVGDFNYALFAGDPGASGTLIASGTTGGTDEGPISFSGDTAGAVSGNLFLTFSLGNRPAGTRTSNNYNQVEVDNIVIDAVPVVIPEPGSLALAAAGLGLLAARRGSRVTSK